MKDFPNRLLTVFFIMGLLGTASLPAAEEQDSMMSIERRIRKIYQKNAPMIVRIGYGKNSNYGSGILVTPEGHVLTRGCSRLGNIRKEEPIAIHLADGRRVNGKVVGWSEEWKIGLLKITDTGPWPHVRIGKRADLEAGQPCIAMGYPYVIGIEHIRNEYDRQPSTRLGCIAKTADSVWATSTCKLRWGDWGSGIFDLEGRLVGLTTILPGSNEPIHASIDLVTEHWDELVAGKNLDRVRLLESKPPKGSLQQALGAPPKTDTEANDLASATERAKAASVRIRLTDQKPGDSSGWSGTIVSAEGHVLTCAHHYHVACENVTIFLPDGSDVAGTILGTNPLSDVGVVKITEKGPWPHVALGGTTEMKPGDRCIAIGYPGRIPQGDPPLIRTTEVVESKSFLEPGPYCLFTTSSSPLFGGDSGGGLFDRAGRLVATHQGQDLGEEGRHIRVEVFRYQWDFLTASKPVDVITGEPLADLTTDFSKLATDLQSSVVEVMGDGKLRALGTVVRCDGRVLTKASELYGTLACRFADGRVFPATLFKVEREHDLAILDVDVDDLRPATWSQSENDSIGTLLAALIPKKPPLPSVVSHSARPIPQEPGNWIALGDVRDGKRGLEVHDDSRAREFDVPIRKGDVIVHIQGHPTPDLEAYVQLQKCELGVPFPIGYAGDPILVGVRRRDDTLQFRFPLPSRDPRMQRLRRRCSAFPSVLDAYLPLNPDMCGGPVIDASGEVAGIVIACRGGGRTHIIPAKVATNIVNQLLKPTAE